MKINLAFDIDFKDLAAQIAHEFTMSPYTYNFLYQQLIDFILQLDDQIADQEFTDRLKRAVANIG